MARRVPRDFNKTRAVAVCNPMSPPMAARLLLNALPSLLDKIPNDDGELDQILSREERIVGAVNSISTAYQNLGMAHLIIQPDFTDPAFHLAYLYQCLVKHCHLIYQTLWLYLPLNVAESWLARAGVNICCIGGGPGTDIIGVVIYLQSLRSYLGRPGGEHIVCHVLDKFAGAWKDAWATLWDTNSELRENSIYSSFIDCNLLDELSGDEATQRAIRQADLVTMVKAFSAFVAFMRDGRDIRQCAVAKLLRQLKRDAIVVFIDNKDKDYVGEWVSSRPRRSQNVSFLEEIARPAGLRVLGEWHDDTYTSLLRAHHNELKTYMTRFGLDRRNPGIRKCAVSVFLLQKQ